MYGPILPMLPVSLTRVLLVGLLLAAAGCSYLRPLPTPILPPDELYTQGEQEMGRKRYLEARDAFRKITERHPNSAWAPRARFLIGEAYYREAEFEKAIKEFETFLSFYPRHEIADLVQYRLSMAYYDQLKPIEQDQGLTAKSLEQFKKLVKEYPDSRYATDALAKIDICRGKLAQKELWVAGYYFNQGNTAAARPRLEFVIKEYPRTLVIPEALYTLAEVNLAEGKSREANELFRQVVNEYGYTEFGKRAAQRLRPGAQR
jgi:outer membrane protein assembly factor BamD